MTGSNRYDYPQRRTRTRQATASMSSTCYTNSETHLSHCCWHIPRAEMRESQYTVRYLPSHWVSDSALTASTVIKVEACTEDTIWQPKMPILFR